MVLDVEDPFTSRPTSRVLENIAPRPPTPPRESPRLNKATGQVLASHAGNERVQLVPSPVSSRDPSPPTSSAESVSEKPKKKVVWSGWTSYLKAETPLTPSRIRPSASTDSKSLKSILKHTPASSFLGSPTPIPDQPLLAHTHSSFAGMLESVVQALASSERSMKLDTYITFCNILRAYDEVPDWNAMEKKIAVLCGFLKRDLVAKMEEGGKADSQLIQQATKLLTIICWYERLVNYVDDQSASFFIQHAIQKIEDPQTSKASVTLYLHFLAQQRFAAPKTMTTDRCNRILTALETLDERVTGKSITKERIDIYHKLLSQSRATMIARAPDWMRNAFGGLLNHVKEVRAHALSFLRDAALVMGKEKSIARTISSIFNQDNEGKRMFESIQTRLEHFVRKEHEGQYVSQLWAVLLLLTQSVGDKWDFFTPWLRIIETCFNVSEPDVKVEAQLAWSKLIYISNIGPNTQRKLLELMCKPVEQYLDPQNATSNTRKPRKAALSNVCAYLYYGFRPNATPKQLSEIWDVVVVGLIQNLVLAGSEAQDGCNILCSLLDGSTQKRWNEDRLLTGQPIMRADEVPRLDPKWVRSHCGKVLNTVEASLGRTGWEDNDSLPGARLLWKRFTKTLADAGSKEIKIAPELMEAVSHIFNLLQRMWNSGAGNLQPTAGISFIEKFTFLIEEALESLGTLCFTEKQLAIDEKSKFVPASTPTHRYSSDSNNGQRHPPLLHIVRLLMDPPTGIPVDDQYLNCLRRILAKCVASQDSRRKKLHLLASCETLLPKRDISVVHLGLWDILAELTRGALPTPTREKVLLSPSPLGGEFKDAILILKWGCQQPVSGWDLLFQELTTVIQSELGEAYVSMHIIGPLAESIRYSRIESNLASNLSRAITFLGKANHSKQKPTIESIFKTHYGISDRKPTKTDPLEALYALSNTLLLQSYGSRDKELNASGIDLYKAAIDFIARAHAGSMDQLKHMQEGLGIWAQDPSHVVSQENGRNATNATKLWERLLQTVESLPRHDCEVLSNLNVLLASGFESRRKGVVNATIKMWNATFGRQSALSYPARLRMVLAKLKTVADISLPSFPEDDAGIHTPPVFESQESYGSQPADEIPWSSPTPARPQLFPDLMSGMRSRTSSPSAKIRETPQNSRSRRSFTPKDKPTPSKPKPKHMDSQIDFVAVEGTPALETQDSQLLTEHQKEVREEQAQAANLFPELAAGVARKSRRMMPLGSPSPSAKPRPEFHVPDTPIHMQANEPRTMIPETTVKGDQAKNPELMVSFISESYIGSTLGSALGSRNSSIPKSIDESNSDNSKVQASDEVSSELTNLDLDNDVTMPNNLDTTSKCALLPPDIHSDEPDGDDNFVDAPDHFNSDNEERIPPQAQPPKPSPDDISPLEDITDIAVAVPPLRDSSRYQAVETFGSLIPGPDVQIVSEIMSATRSPPPKRGGRKRKRLAPTSEGRHVSRSPKASGTIIVAEPEQPLMRPLLPRSPALERPSKRPKIPATEDTPMKPRASARSTKCKRLGLRNAMNRLVSVGSDLDGMSADQSQAASPTPARTRQKKSRATQEDKTPREEQANDTPFIQETQISSFSSVPDSQENRAAPRSRVGPTPTKGRKPKGLLTDDVDRDEFQVRGPKRCVLETDNPETARPRLGPARRSKRRLALSTTASGTGEKEIAESQLEENIGKIGALQPQVVEHSPAVAAIEALRSALRVVDATEMTKAEIASIEDEVFEAFSKLRERRVKATK